MLRQSKLLSTGFSSIFIETIVSILFVTCEFGPLIEQDHRGDQKLSIEPTYPTPTPHPNIQGIGLRIVFFFNDHGVRANFCASTKSTGYMLPHINNRVSLGLRDLWFVLRNKLTHYRGFFELFSLLLWFSSPSYTNTQLLLPISTSISDKNRKKSHVSFCLH